MFTDFPDLLDGKLLVPSSNDVEGVSEGGLPYGAISGYLTKTQPKPIKRFYALPYELCKVKNVEAKYYLMLRNAVPADIRLIVMPNPSSLTLLADKMGTLAEELVYDIRNGTVNDAYREGVPDVLLKGFAPDPDRADELQAVIKRSGTLTPCGVTLPQRSAMCHIRTSWRVCTRRRWHTARCTPSDWARCTAFRSITSTASGKWQMTSANSRSSSAMRVGCRTFHSTSNGTGATAPSWSAGRRMSPRPTSSVATVFPSTTSRVIRPSTTRTPMWPGCG
jgi:hypothetical protein